MSEDNFNFLAPYFKDLKLIGTGGSGTVYSALDVETDQRVALKRLVLQDRLNCKAALRQVRVLQNLQHENIVRFLKVVDSRGTSLTENFKGEAEAFMIQELVETDLLDVINSNGPLQPDHVRLFLYQLLRGLKYLHSANVIHRDAKPSNLLVDSDTLLLKIGDFGQSRVLDTDYDHKAKLTHKPSSLWYRAPEISFTPYSYDSSIDIWTAGCVFAEMLLGKPMFEGKHELEQMELILDTVSLSEEDRKKVKTQMPEKFLKNDPGMTSRLREKFGSEPDLEALDLLEQMLQFNPERRITAAQALAHPFLRDYSFPRDEPICSNPLHIEHEVDDFPEDLLKDMILEECLPIPGEDQPSLEEVVVDKSLEPLNHILSLKDLMTDVEPLTAREIQESSFKGEKNDVQIHLECEVKHRLGIDSIKESRETLAAAMMFQGIFNGEQSPIQDDKDIKILGSNVLTNVFSKRCVNDKFTCKKNVLAGPFGLYYYL